MSLHNYHEEALLVRGSFYINAAVDYHSYNAIKSHVCQSMPALSLVLFVLFFSHGYTLSC
jgi:hypothetical protein